MLKVIVVHITPSIVEATGHSALLPAAGGQLLKLLSREFPVGTMLGDAAHTLFCTQDCWVNSARRACESA